MPKSVKLEGNLSVLKCGECDMAILWFDNRPLYAALVELKESPRWEFGRCRIVIEQIPNETKANDKA